MRFNRLEICCFRNLSNVVLELAPGLNTFYGENGAGKTALLEAVHLLCRGRSFRTQNSRSLIQHGEKELLVRAVIEDELRGPTRLAIRKDAHSRTELKLNGLPERRLSEIARLTPIQVMLPDIAELVFGGPSLRRSWLDWGMFHVKPEYLHRLRRYLRSVKQRNAMMKEGGNTQALRPWNEEVARLGEAVTQDRQEYIGWLTPHFQSVLAELAPEIVLDLRYHRGWAKDEALHKLLAEPSPREVKYGTTLWGPHRADVQIRLDGAPAAAILSRGQGKLVASALQIGQAALLSGRDQRSTVFLIDDAGAELDLAHNERFFGVLQRTGGQILATTTRIPNASRQTSHGFIGNRPEAGVFHVKHGAIVAQGGPGRAGIDGES